MHPPITIPPILPPPTEVPAREGARDRFGTAVWNLITAYSGVIDDDEMRQELEGVLLMYYGLAGDGTVTDA